MIKRWQHDGWRRWFTLIPMYLSDGPNKQFIWLEWVWLRGNGFYVEVSLTDPRQRP